MKTRNRKRVHGYLLKYALGPFNVNLILFFRLGVQFVPISIIPPLKGIWLQSLQEDQFMHHQGVSMPLNVGIFRIMSITSEIHDRKWRFRGGVSREEFLGWRFWGGVEG
jgi:hypothetical protein